MEWPGEDPYHRVFDEARSAGNFLGILLFYYTPKNEN